MFSFSTRTPKKLDPLGRNDPVPDGKVYRDPLGPLRNGHREGSQQHSFPNKDTQL